MAAGADWRAGLQDLFDQVLNLSAVQWGFIWISAAAVFAWIWVMGGPKGRRPLAAAAAATLAGVGVLAALAVLGPSWTRAG